MELLVARNPDPASRLPFLLLVPLEGGKVFRAREPWPRTTAVYCHPVPLEDWPAEPEIIERVPLKACTRRGAAVDLVADRRREQRSQLVVTRARGRQVVFWQAPRTTRQSRPGVRVPRARAQGLPELTVLVDTRERYPYRFAAQGDRVATRRQALPCGDYAVADDRGLVGVVERKSLADLVGSLTSGRLRYQLAELAAQPRAALVVEDRWAKVFALEHLRPGQVADGLAEVAVRWPTVPLVWCDNRKLAEEWTYRFLAACLRHGEERIWADQLLDPPAPQP
ncbi:ERCC4 domain-containing protein [Aciditerrimonas ferrireducens]|uniref:ERCC4 domain-containing protein n=1 Tax=Aciditerrimonas ferrireducens TaxID=667306 RepID=A0ABV6BYV9_9ACTN